MISEQEFIAKIQANQGIIHKVTRMYFSGKADQEDLFQEIVLQLWRAYPRFQGRSKFSTWMYRVALNTAITHFRKDKKTKDNSSLDENHIQIEGPEHENMNRKEEINQLYAAINHLSATDKAIVLLHLEGYAYKEISEIVGISEVNVRVKMTRIRKKIKNILEV